MLFDWSGHDAFHQLWHQRVRHTPTVATKRRCGVLWWPAMALHLHRAERTDLLADGLGALLANPLPDPFAEELVLVPARGVERWLSQRLSHVLGRWLVPVTGCARGWRSAVRAR